jgi:hypothetical protein
MLQCIVMGVEGKFYFHTIFEFSDLRVLKLRGGWLILLLNPSSKSRDYSNLIIG